MKNIMKQKTAMQDLISYFKKRGYMYAVLKAEELLEKEKEQIIDAYDNGLFDGSMDDVNDRVFTDYYNETYKQD